MSGNKFAYLAAAFSARPFGMPVPPNWFMLAAFGLLGTFVDPGFWLIGLGLEGIYLWALSSHPRFQAVVDATKEDREDPSDWHTQYRSLSSRLDDSGRRAQAEMEQQGAALTDVLTRSGAFPAQLADVRQLVWLHLKLLGARAALREVIDAATREQHKLNAQHRQLTDRLSAQDLDVELRSSLEGQLEIIRSRNAAHALASKRCEFVDAELDGLRQQISLVREQALLATDESGVARSVDALSASLNEANRWLKDQRELFAGMESFPDEPPPPELLGRRRGVPETETRSLGMRPRTPVPRVRGSAIGNILTAVLLIALLGLGAWLVFKKQGSTEEGATAAANDSRPAATAPTGDAPEAIEPVTGTPVLEAAAPYQMKDGTVEIDLSEYAGYGGLIVANGGLEPNAESFFAKQYGFKVKLTVSESETWSKLNNGRLAATATTADALAVLGRQFDAVVPVQIGCSRGADMLVVDAGISSVNALAGKTLAASQFNESEFFIRYLAQEAGVPVQVLRDLDSKPAEGTLGLVFYEDAFEACDAYAHELAGRSPKLAGCVGWTPRTDEVVANSSGRAKVLVSNRNLLVIADVLTVNGGFAKAHPEVVQGLVHGLLEGNRLLRDSPDQHIGVLAKAFNWSDDKARTELSRVHLSNLPENLAFFSGTLDVAGSFGGIFQSSVLAYGSIIRNPADPQRFVDSAALQALQKKGCMRISASPLRPFGRRSRRRSRMIRC